MNGICEVDKGIGASGRHPSWHGSKAGRPGQQPGQGSEGILPRSHVWWLGESRKQPRLSPGALRGSIGFPVKTTRLPAWLFGRLSHCRRSQHDLRPTVRPQSSHIKWAPQFLPFIFYKLGKYILSVDAKFTCYKQSPDNARSVAFCQRAIRPTLIEDEIFNESDIISNLIGYEDGQEPDSLRADKIYAETQLSNKSEKHFLKIDTNAERSLKFQIKLRSCIYGYRDIYKQLTTRPSLQKLICYFMLPKNKSIEIVPLIEETIFNLFITGR
ncbi:uncharacterized protein TNCV_3534791 [Trichonephila clavipes]|nr:uncharacterized protein TNCV_3534791 [Trichonephila clavipes]